MSKIRYDYLANCRDCPEKNPVTRLFRSRVTPRSAQKHAELHAKRHPGHRTFVINLQQLRTVSNYEFTALEQVERPPF